MNRLLVPERSIDEGIQCAQIKLQCKHESPHHRPAAQRRVQTYNPKLADNYGRLLAFTFVMGMLQSRQMKTVISGRGFLGLP
jgi:hypothetical protein